jgi:hypothetical protein
LHHGVRLPRFCPENKAKWGYAALIMASPGMRTVTKMQKDREEGGQVGNALLNPGSSAAVFTDTAEFFSMGA